VGTNESSQITAAQSQIDIILTQVNTALDSMKASPDQSVQNGADGLKTALNDLIQVLYSLWPVLIKMAEASP
jgi:hypothetical protein